MWLDGRKRRAASARAFFSVRAPSAECTARAAGATRITHPHATILRGRAGRPGGHRSSAAMPEAALDDSFKFLPRLKIGQICLQARLQHKSEGIRKGGQGGEGWPLCLGACDAATSSASASISFDGLGHQKHASQRPLDLKGEMSASCRGGGLASSLAGVREGQLVCGSIRSG